MFTVKRAAELTGLTPDTLRVWERRYGVVVPQRSPGGYRLYDDAALARLTAMKSLVDSGWSVRAAANHVLEQAASEADRSAARPVTAFPDLGALSEAGRDFDPDALTAALDTAFACGPFERVVDAWLMPALERVGADWRDGQVTVAAEHFVSAAVQRRLATIHDALAPGDGVGPSVLVGLARGSRHELGVLAFAVAARREGLDVTYVGSDLPSAEWATTARAREARAVVIGVPSAEDVPAVRETVEAVRRESPDIQVWLGGGHQGAVGGAARPLGHRIGDAAAALADALG